MSPLEDGNRLTYHFSSFEYEVGKIFLYAKVNTKAKITSASSNASIKTIKLDDKGAYTIFEFEFTNPRAENVNFNFVVQAANGETAEYVIELSRKAADSNSKLSAFTYNSINVPSWSTDHSGTSNIYTIKIPGVNNPSINLYAKAASTKAKIEYSVNGVTGNYDDTIPNATISFSRNVETTITVKVTAQDGSYSTFIIKILSANSNANIKSVTLNGISTTIDLSSDSVTIEVPYTFTSTKLNAVLDDAFATINSEVLGDWVLAEGNNTKKIIVTSEDKSQTKEFTITINRQQARTHNYLDSLTVNGAAITLDSLKTDYTYRIDDSVSAADVVATIPNDKGSKITNSDNTLTSEYEYKHTFVIESGSYVTVDIYVQAENGKTNNYKIKIYRANNSANISNVIINNEQYLMSQFDSNNTLKLSSVRNAVASLPVRFGISAAAEKSSIVILEGNYSQNADRYSWNLNVAENNNSRNFVLQFQVISQYASIGGKDGYKSPVYTITVEKEAASTVNTLRKLEVMINGRDYFLGKTIKNDLDDLIVGSNDVNLVEIYAYILQSDYSSIVGLTDNYYIDGDYIVYKLVLNNTAIDNQIVINVQSEAGGVNPYYLDIIRKNQVNTINGISVDGQAIDLSGTFPYVLDAVRYNIASIKFNITKEDPKSVLYINGQKIGSNLNATQEYIYNLVDGDNTIQIQLKTEYENGPLSDPYTFTVYRTPANDNIDLDKAEIFVDINGTSTKIIDYVNGNTISKVRINNDVESATVNAYLLKSNYTKIKTLGKATVVMIEGIEYLKYTATVTFTTSEEKISITVYSEAENYSQTYDFPIVRKNNNNAFDDIVARGYDGEDYQFINTTTVYNLGSVPYKTSKLSFDIVKEDPSSTLFVKVNSGSPKSYTTNGIYGSDIEVTLAAGNNTIVFYLVSEYGTKGTEYSYTISRAAASNNKKLGNIEFNSNETNFLESYFNNTSLEYVLFIDRDTYPNSSFEINVTPDDVNATVQISFGVDSANNSLMGILKTTMINEITINVTAEDGSSKAIYKVYVYYASNNYQFDKIEIDGEDVFGSNIHELTRTWDIDTFDLNVIAKHANAKVNLTAGKVNGENNLVGGNNKFNVSITSELGKIYDTAKVPINVTLDRTTSDVYALNIVKEIAYTDTTLTGLVVKNAETNAVIPFDEIQFDPNKRNYNITFEDETVKRITIGYTKNNETKQNVIINSGAAISDFVYINGVLNVTISIEVRAQGVSDFYKITFKKGIDLSDDVTFTSISLYDLNDASKTNLITFDPSGTNTLEVKYKIAKVALAVVTNHPNATVVYVGNSGSNVYSLTEGSNTNIQFYILAEDGTTKSDTYTITVNRATASNDVSLKDIKLKNIVSNEVIPFINTVDFTKDIINIYIAGSITGVEVILVPSYEGAIIPVNNSRETLTRAKVNTFTYYVKSENESITKKYTVNIIPGSDEANINSFTIKIGTNTYQSSALTFDESTNTYTLNNIAYKETSGTITFNASPDSLLYNATETIELKNINNTFTFENVSENQRNTKSITVAINKVAPDTVNTLSSLKVEGYGFVEGAFVPNKTNYTIALPLDANITSLKVMATRTSSLSQIEGFTDGVKTYNVAKNDAGYIVAKLEVKVIAESGDALVYTIDVIQANTEKKSDDVTFTSISLYDLNDASKTNLITFDPSGTNTLEVKYKIAKVALAVVTNHPNATVVYVGNSGSNVYSLTEGSNTNIQFYILAEDGTTKSDTYTITVNRATASNDVSLKDIKLKNIVSNEVIPFINTVDFTKDIINIYIAGSITGVEVILVPSYEGAIIPVNNSRETLTRAKVNTFTYYVKSENESITKKYTVNIIPGSDEANINSFTIKIGTNTYQSSALTFDESTNTYTLNNIAYKETSGTITFNASPDSLLYNATETIELKNINNTFTFENVSENQRNTKSITVAINKVAPDTVNTLSSLKVEGYGFVEGAFVPNKTNYTIALPLDANITSLKVMATRTSSLSQIEGFTDGVKTYNVAKNDAGYIVAKLEVKVIAESGDALVYTIDVIQANTDEKSDDNSIKDNPYLFADNKTYYFDPSSTYPVQLPYSAGYVDLSGIPNSPVAKILPQNVKLNPGLNNITYEIIAENGTSSEYTIKVYRALPDSDNTLKTLTIKYQGKTYNLIVDGDDNTIETYELTLEKAAKFVEVIYATNSPSALVSQDYSGGFTLSSTGTSVIMISVVAEDMSVKNYTVTINTLDTSANLTLEITDKNGLAIDNTVDNSNPTKVIYTLNALSYDNNYLNINIVPENVYVKYDSAQAGRRDLNVGPNEFIITATSEDGKTTIQYIIRVERLNGTNTTKLTDLSVTTVSGTALLETFAPDTNEYLIKLPISFNGTKVIIGYEIDDAKSVVTGAGEKTLTNIDGAIFNKFTVKVTSEIGEVNEYVITIVKSYDDNLSSDNGFKSVKVKSIVREKTYEYYKGLTTAINIDPIDERVQIVVDLNNDKAKVLCDIDLTNIRLPEGEEFKTSFTIQAENGTVSEPYEIKLKRAAKSNNNKLGNLSINGNNITLKADTFKYVYIVADEVTTQLKVVASPEDVNAKLNIPSPYMKNFSLTTYNDEIIIVVTAENGDTQTYLIEIVRESAELELDNIVIDGETVEFDANKVATIVDRLYSQKRITLEVFVQNPNVKLVLKFNGKTTRVGNEINSELDLIVGQNELEIYATTDNGLESDHYKVYLTRLDPSPINYLNDLKVYNATANKEYTINFDKDNLNYIIEENDINSLSTLRIVATPGDPYQVIDGDGYHSIDTGSIEGTTVVIKSVFVTAENGETREYKITIAKKVEPNSDISVQDLALMGDDNVVYLGTANGSLSTFSNHTKEYNITVPYKVKNVTLYVYNPNTNNIIYNVDNQTTNNKTILLNKKSTKISFYLISKDGTTNNQADPYIINVIKEDPSTNANLSYLNLDGNLLTGFNKNVYLYTDEVDANLVTKVLIEAQAENANATIEGLGEYSVILGMNTFRIKVTAEDGITSKTYTIIINSLRSNNDMIDIRVDGYDLDKPFDRSITAYELTVEYDVEYIRFINQSSEGSTISVNGLQKLEVGRNRFEIYATAENGQNGVKYRVDIIRKEISNDATLSDLVITNGSKDMVINFNPIFDPYTTNYVINLDSEALKEFNISSIWIDATANNQYATVGGLGYQNLAKDVEGNYQNVFKIIVRAQSGTTKTYTLTVYKGVNLSSDISIEEISLIGNNAINYLGTDVDAINLFKENLQVYNLVVPYNVDTLSLVVNTKANVDGAGTKSFGNSNTLSFNLRIYSIDGTNSKSYTINLTREDALTENSLSSIKVNGKDLFEFDADQAFNGDKLAYEIRIPFGSTNNKAVIAAQPKDFNSKVTVNGEKSGYSFDLEKGKNIYSIVVTAQNGSVKTYTLTIIHSDGNALLEDLTIEGVDLVFDPDCFEYSIVIDPSITEITIKASAQDSNASIIGASTKKLSGTRDKFEVNVISEDGLTVKTYVINVTTERIPSSDTRLKSLVISGLELNFTGDNRTYKVTANKSLKDIVVVDAEPLFERATVEITGDGELFDGNNILLIKVTAEDGTEGYYKINIYKAAAPDYFFITLLIATFVLWFITILVIIIRHQLNKRNNASKVNYY